ncbi:MAG: Segregation and condensation protein A [uncultured Thiotrichaceae bacterium]|uniref:Segregation and condensation protein A n=1 Tax=uncultured Thiotrichaceae bacterium TaxID=298394 RepID=A0A6S6SSB7_9GAMM|nr:MAG: Segregation and condensation protein A [uncultured Thiotrichaceae bacterium]
MSAIQREIPLAVVRGEKLSVFPEDLYIPPDALEVILEAFEGPLDLLLYLIKRQNLDICDIPIAAITVQYMTYVELMKDFKLDLAAEYLVMAAMLAEIKSRMLLPKRVEAEDEDDPRAELIRRLQEYEQCKQASVDLDELPRLGREFWQVQSVADFPEQPRPLPEVELSEILQAFRDVLQRADMFTSHEIKREYLSIRERMTHVLATLQEHKFVAFSQLFSIEEGRRGAVVTLMAILELLKAQIIDVVQSEDSYAPLYVRGVS